MVQERVVVNEVAEKVQEGEVMVVVVVVVEVRGVAVVEVVMEAWEAEEEEVPDNNLFRQIVPCRHYHSH